MDGFAKYKQSYRRELLSEMNAGLQFIFYIQQTEIVK